MKKLLCVLVALALCFAMVKLPAKAVNTSDLFYEIHDGQVTITDCDTSAQGTLIIPSQIDGYPVTKIGDYAFADCDGLKTVHISGSVTTIGDYAFYDSGVNSLHIFNGVTTIGDYAFARCFNLSSLYIPDTVTSIGDYAFYYCYNLTSVTIPDSVTHIGAYAFYMCYDLESVTLPNGLTEIGEGVFYYCHDLTSVDIPQGVTRIGDHAFYYCYNLATATMANSVTAIGDYAFYHCSPLTNMELPDHVETIGEYAFYYCKGPTTLTIPASVTHLGKASFASTKIKTVNFIGNAPEITGSENNTKTPFEGNARTAYCHADTTGWNSTTMKAFGENLTWTLSGHNYSGGVCSICGDRGAAACTHRYAEGVWTTEPTCTADGQKSYTCELCGHVKYDTFAATGHRMQITDASPSCTEEGYRLCACEYCDYSYLENVTPPTGHHYEDGICTICGLVLPGDVSLDGAVDILDVAILYTHIQGTNTITDPIALRAADYTGDGAVSIVDVARLYGWVKIK